MDEQGEVLFDVLHWGLEEARQSRKELNRRTLTRPCFASRAKYLNVWEVNYFQKRSPDRARRGFYLPVIKTPQSYLVADPDISAGRPTPASAYAITIPMAAPPTAMAPVTMVPMSMVPVAMTSVAVTMSVMAMTTVTMTTMTSLFYRSLGGILHNRFT